MELTIREQSIGDEPFVAEVNEQAFGRIDEASLVEKLVADGDCVLSLVALAGDQIVGHILFSNVAIMENPNAEKAVGLAPMSVLPEMRNQGIGGMLVREGLKRLAEMDYELVVVLGHPPYYPRFGFEPSAKFGIRWEHNAPEEAFMALELVQGAAKRYCGTIRFRPAFDGV